MKILQPIIVLTLILIWHGLAAQEFPPDEIGFIRQKTISFQRDVEAISIADFRALKFDDHIVVYGLGEANHGTKEFQLLKLKLAEYLIEEKGLTTILIEFPYAQGLLLDDYVKGKNQDGLNILTDQNNSEYKNTDFIHFINAIKKMNEDRDEASKISFLGGDIFGKPTAIKLLKEYFAKVDSAQLEIFSPYQKFQQATYLSVFDQDKSTFDKLSKKARSRLRKNKHTYISNSSLEEYNIATRLAEALEIKWKGNQRAVSFAGHALNVLEEHPKNKILVIAHNGHVGKLDNEVGSLLKRKLKDAYLSIGTDYEAGTFSLWNLKDPGNQFVDTLYTPTLAIGFAHKFSTLAGNFHYISFDEVDQLPSEWTTQENYITSVGRGFNTDLSSIDFRRKVRVTKYFDALFIFKKIHASTRLK